MTSICVTDHCAVGVAIVLICVLAGGAIFLFLNIHRP